MGGMTSCSVILASPLGRQDYSLAQFVVLRSAEQCLISECWVKEVGQAILLLMDIARLIHAEPRETQAGVDVHEASSGRVSISSLVWPSMCNNSTGNPPGRWELFAVLTFGPTVGARVALHPTNPSSSHNDLTNDDKGRPHRKSLAAEDTRRPLAIPRSFGSRATPVHEGC